MTKARSERAKALQKLARFPLDGSIGPTGGLNSQLGTEINGSAADFGSIGMNMSSDSATLGGTYPSIPTTSAYEINGGLQHSSFMSMDQTQMKNEQLNNSSVDNIDEVNANIDTRDLWSPDPNLFAQNPPMMLEDTNWNGWDDMIKDFSKDDENGLGLMGEKGAASGTGGMVNWW